MWKTLVAPLQALLIIFDAHRSPDDLRRGPEAHMRFVEALRKGDGDEGEREMVRQMDDSGLSLLAWRAGLAAERTRKVD